MAQYIADRRDVDFVLYEQFHVEDLSKHEKFRTFNKKAIDLIISEVRNLAIKEILPSQQLGDREGCTFENGRVTVPESFHRAYKLINEGEWIALPDDPQWGGQGMPRAVAVVVNEYLIGANCAFMMYQGVGSCTGKLIAEAGTEKQKELYLKKMFSGKWTGTMVITEPQAGTDVGLLTTSAVKNTDGTYSISGNKVFITGGEHDLSENIIHPVLARLEGAPAGARGLSLFLVPKIRVNDDGSLGEFNDVVCTGIEPKMGINGSATCALTFGGNGKCRGTLIGEENKGLQTMFLMMNEARRLVSLQGFSMATCSYMYAVNYARERIQGKNVLQMTDPNAPSVPIIQHPDVRRQLLLMKAYIEGMRSLLYFIEFCDDRIAISEDADEKTKYQDLVDLLLPVVKGYVTDKSFKVCNQGVQVYGGSGYIKEYPVEQLLRDCRVMMIYEGTNGIQGMDLVERKLGMKDGKPFNDFLEAIHKTIVKAEGISGLESLAVRVKEATDKMAEVAHHIVATAMSPRKQDAYAQAHPVLDAVGDVLMAWMLLWRATIAAPKLERLVGSNDKAAIHAKAKENKDAAFYEGQLKTAEFFICSLLPITIGKLNAIAAANGAAVEIPEESFGG